MFNFHDDSRNEKWDDAFTSWLSTLKSDRTKLVYKNSWRYALEHINKPPWIFGKKDVILWCNGMKERGLSLCTIQLRLAALSSFYEFVNNDYTLTENDKEVSLFSINPAKGKNLRTKINPYGKAVYLTKEQVSLLLSKIDRTTLKGLRDYALILTYVFTGRRNSEVRNLKWGDFYTIGDKVFYTWSGKGKFNQKNELPLTAYKAIVDYLRKSGKSLNPETYIFTSTLSKVNAPICMREAGKILKSYAKASGLDYAKLHIHCLRHTAAILRLEIGDDILQISDFLAHSNLSITQIYLHNIRERDDSGWKKVETLCLTYPNLVYSNLFYSILILIKIEVLNDCFRW